MGVAARARQLMHAFVGEPTELPRQLVDRFPEVGRARWRRGGLPVRVGGWCLGRSTVSAITLWDTIWLAPDLEPSGELLLHELRHVDQFAASRLFPLAYLWQSVRHGYVRNRFEIDACAYAARRIRESSARLP